MKKETKKVLIGYNCKVCRGSNFIESKGVVSHICSGYAEPVYEAAPKTETKKQVRSAQRPKKKIEIVQGYHNSLDLPANPGIE